MLRKALHTISHSTNVDIEELTETEEKVEEKIDHPWRLFLFDDDIHTFDEVIEQLIKATGCSYSHAQEITLKVHQEGKAIVHEGEFLECLKIESILKEIQLVTEIRG